MLKGVYTTCTIAAEDIVTHIIDALGAQYQWGRWWRRHRRGGGGEKMSTRAPTKGINYCPLKPRQWLQSAE
eukprot:15363004-Ditylum_brightwellii.AAC.1